MALPDDPWLAATSDLPAQFAGRGFALLRPAQLAELTGTPVDRLAPLATAWSALPPDAWLRDGGSYRFRRHDSYVMALATGQLTLVPHRAHWQPVAYNALHGGLERWFEPVETRTRELAGWPALIAGIGRAFAQLAATQGRAPPRWYIEAHQFRIDTANGIGRPTPEGAHRDGVDFVAVVLVERHWVKGGETRVFDAQGPSGCRFVMAEAWSALLLDDQRVVHETTPIQPDGGAGWRDTLVLTFRADGFQNPVI